MCMRVKCIGCGLERERARESEDVISCDVIYVVICDVISFRLRHFLYFVIVLSFVYCFLSAEEELFSS